MHHLCFLQGVCTVRDLRNISLVEERVREPVVANNATASTVAFIAPGPPNPPITQVMYVGVTWTGNGPYRSEVPAASSRSLDSGTLFQIAGNFTILKQNLNFDLPGFDEKSNGAPETVIWTHHSGMNFYVNVLGRLGSNRFQLI